jgi:Uma2 family endonuclease
MSTLTKLGPADHGHPVALDEFLAADFENGYEYEIIDGKLYVSPKPNLPQDWVERWLYRKLDAFAEACPQIINYVTTKARVFVPGRPDETCPEPDLAAYRRFPLHRPIRQIRWEQVSPILVGEILSEDDPDKHLVRNVALYLAVASIKEYWIVDSREDPERPTLRVHERYRKSWRVKDYPYGQVYRTKLLPGFTLLIDPRS